MLCIVTYSKTGHAMYCHIQYVFHMIEDDRQGQHTNDGSTVMVAMHCTRGRICTYREKVCCNLVGLFPPGRCDVVLS